MAMSARCSRVSMSRPSAGNTAMPQLAVLARDTSSIMQGSPSADCSRSITSAACAPPQCGSTMTNSSPDRRPAMSPVRSSAWMRWATLHSSRSRSEEHTSELQSPCNLVCRLLLEKKKKQQPSYFIDQDHHNIRPTLCYHSISHNNPYISQQLQYYHTYC